MSEPPSHPALLDWLAAKFVEEGGSPKKLHRRILLSATYRQSSAAPRKVVAQDPDNRWLARFTARRLEAESIRDAALFVAGRLDMNPAGAAHADLSSPRRSLYIQTARWDRSSFATLFDAANPDASDERRIVSTVAPQALFLLNNSFTLAQANQLAERLIREVPDTTPDFETARITHAYKLLFSRTPTKEELIIARQLVGGIAQPGTWADLAHVLLCHNEFVYVD